MNCVSISLIFCLCPLITAYQQDFNFTVTRCMTEETITPPKNYSLPVYFPSGWNENLTVPTYVSNQACTWNVKIPENMFVQFSMLAEIPWDADLIITDANMREELVMSSEMQPYVFVKEFTITFNVGPDGPNTKLGFQIQWMDYPTPYSKKYSIGKADEALLFDEMLAENSVVITAETRVSLIAFPTDFPDLTPCLRLTLLFDGPDLHSPYLGTLYQAFQTSVPVLSTSNTMTIFTFQDDFIVGSNFVIQDYYNVQKLAETRGVTCWSVSSCPVTLNAAKGPVSAMTLNYVDGNEYVKRLDVSYGSELKVYLGSRREGNESNLIATYNYQQARTNIPQKFNGFLLTYYLENGTALVELAEDMNYTRWNDAAPGREGFISSLYYGFDATYQDTTEFIQGLYLNCTFTYSVNITHLDVSNGSRLILSFTDEQGTTDFEFLKELPVGMETVEIGRRRDMRNVVLQTTNVALVSAIKAVRSYHYIEVKDALVPCNKQCQKHLQWSHLKAFRQTLSTQRRDPDDFTQLELRSYFNSENKASSRAFSYKSSVMKVNYTTTGAPSSGFFLYFKIDDHMSSARDIITLSLLNVILLTIVLHLIN